MKELSIEQKAKAYDEAFKEASVAHKDEDRHLKATLERIFPELKESEDEMIRKAIIEGLREMKSSFHTISSVKIDDAIAWLEKQGGQKLNPVIDIEIPFGANDSELQEASYHIPEGFHAEIEGNRVVIKRGEQKPTDKVEPKFKIGDKVKKGYLTYTVEDIGEDSYKLQAYSKDGDKGSTVFLTIGYEKDYELVEQKPVWSEEDETMITDLSVIVHTYFSEISGIPFKYDLSEDKIRTWLKSLKDRVQPQPKQEWSEEDERLMKNLKSTLANLSARKLIEKETEEKYVSWLKSIRPQKRWKPSEEMLEALYRLIPENTMEKSEDEMLLDKLYQGLKYGRVLSKN